MSWEAVNALKQQISLLDSLQSQDWKPARRISRAALQDAAAEAGIKAECSKIYSGRELLDQEDSVLNIAQLCIRIPKRQVRPRVLRVRECRPSASVPAQDLPLHRAYQ